jgi:hypothetical protein
VEDYFVWEKIDIHQIAAQYGDLDNPLATGILMIKQKLLG